MEMINEYNNLLELKDWWFNNQDKWFNSNESNDIEISKKYQYLLDLDYKLEILINDKILGLSYIILYDQITRHVARAQNKPSYYVFDYLDKLIKFIDLFYPKYKNELNGWEFCFTLLPLRHTNIFDKQKFVMNETWGKILNINQTDTKLIQIYKNYLEATYKRATIEEQVYISKNKTESIDDILWIINKYNDLLDKNCHQNILSLKSNLVINDNIILKITKTCEQIKNKNNKYILSISGGVDSMILSYVLSKLDIDFLMVHINYANREETCENEKKLLSDWAGYLGKKLYIRDIYEINRQKCMKYEMRNLYERYTRDVRYQSYIDICKLNGWENSEWYVLMGHNHDDCIENILTNITNKTKYENLMGMSFVSEIIFRDQKIKFIRPLITIQKSDIYHCAHKFNIPYLIDSTPKWSQRGIIRDVVRPALIQWNNLILEGMVELNTIMKESLECVDLLVTKWLNELKPLESLSSNEIIRIPSLTISKIATSNIKLNIIKLNITEISDNKIFWSRLFDKLNISTSSKILDELINRLRIIKKKFTSIQIKQLNQIQINKNNKLYCWKVLDNNIIFGFDCGL